MVLLEVEQVQHYLEVMDASGRSLLALSVEHWQDVRLMGVKTKFDF